MGDRMKCITTPKTMVMQGDAKPLQNRCCTTTPPKGVGVVVMLLHLLRAEVMQTEGWK
ncbi:hypothetical protein [Mangrovicoccus sp. HB161399]|uniref:hypothetical protein n=1 Tax=Mangrovicoccus sp. HB161399 TaxID=2720392 RepID=UPI00155461C5|nr:hypothetical protein [Mangrovicoccus sp. HB161399]